MLNDDWTSDDVRKVFMNPMYCLAPPMRTKRGQVGESLDDLPEGDRRRILGLPSKYCPMSLMVVVIFSPGW